MYSIHFSRMCKYNVKDGLDRQTQNFTVANVFKGVSNGFVEVVWKNPANFQNCHRDPGGSATLAAHALCVFLGIPSLNYHENPIEETSVRE